MAIIEFENLIVISAGILNLLFGLAVFIRGEKTTANRSFFALTSNLFLWSMVLVFARVTSDYETALFLTRFLYVIAGLIPYFFLIFARLFLAEEFVPSRLALLLTPMILAAALALFTDGVIVDVAIRQNQNIPIFGSWYPIWIVYLLFYFTVGLILLFRRLGKFVNNSIERLQLKFVLTGALIPIIISIITNVILLSIFNNFGYRWIGPTSTVIMTALFSYAIFKHNLFNLKIIATEFFSAFLVLTLFFQTIFAKNTTDFILKGILFITTTVFGILLIKSVLKEILDREKITMLAGELQKTNEELKKLDAAKSEFISLASRELNQPLSFIKNGIGFILEGRFDASDKIKNILERVAFSTNQLAKMVTSMLNLADIESGKMRYQFKKEDFARFLENIVAELKPHAEKKGLTLQFKTDIKEIFFLFDPDKMREVAVNLIDNAIKYSSAGTIEVDLRFLSRGVSESLEFRVKDKGLGISKADMARLFTKFVRSEEARKIDPNGMGLGLYFVKMVVEGHGGKIKVESEGMGKGSTFVVELPLNLIPAS